MQTLDTCTTDWLSSSLKRSGGTSTPSQRTVSCSEVIYVRPTVNTVFIDKHCCSSVLMLRSHQQSSLILYALLTVSLVLGLSSRLTCSQDNSSWSAVRASDTLTGSFACYKFRYFLLTYVLTYIL